MSDWELIHDAYISLSRSWQYLPFEQREENDRVIARLYDRLTRIGDDEEPYGD